MFAVSCCDIVPASDSSQRTTSALRLRPHRSHRAEPGNVGWDLTWPGQAEACWWSSQLIGLGWEEGGWGLGDGWCKHYYGADQIKDVVVTESRLVTIIVKSSQNNWQLKDTASTTRTPSIVCVLDNNWVWKLLVTFVYWRFFKFWLEIIGMFLQWLCCVRM